MSCPNPEGPDARTGGPSPTSAPTATEGAPAPTEDGSLPRGATVGRYLVLERIGSGGMGVVYAAYDPQLDRRVALKLVRGEDAGGGQARLLREAQAMARLDHPNVLAVHDVGTLGDRVFLAIDLVEGGSLKAWLRETRRPWREVLPLFLAAGRGLAAAHAAGLVHRDFKPDNVLLSRDGRARVTDFGIARSTGPAPTGPPPPGDSGPVETPSGAVSAADALTRAGDVMGTPGYMAPEQLGGGLVDARTDQFSFCASLFEGLYGHRPFAGRSVEEYQRELLGGQLQLPRGGDVPGWVERAVLRGLSARPADRWPSMEALLDALGRDPGAARRRAVAAAAGLLAVVAAIAGARELARRQGRVCEIGESALAGAWDGAARAAVQKAFEAIGKPWAADTGRAVVAALDHYAGGWTAMRREACEAARIRKEQTETVMTLRMSCLDHRREELGSLAALLAHGDEGLARRAPQAAAQLSSLASCADVESLLAPVAPPADPGARATVEAARKRLAETRAAYAAGKYKDALATLRELETGTAGLGYAPLDAEVLGLEGRMLDRLGDQKGAKETLQRAIWAADAGRHDEARAQAWLWMVMTAQTANFDEAVPLGRSAEAAIRRLGGRDDLESARLNAVAGALLRKGSFADALEMQRKAATLREKAFGPDAEEMSPIYNNMGATLEQLGKLEEALALYRRTLAIDEKALGPSHPELALTLVNVGNVLDNLGRREEARAALERAAAIQEASLGADHPDLLVTWANLADLLINAGHAAEARPLLEKARAGTARLFGDDHFQVAQIIANLGRVELAEGRPALAEARFDEADRLLERTVGERHPAVVETLAELAESQLAQSKNAAAASSAERALALAQSAQVVPEVVAGARFRLARILWARDRAGDRRRARSLAQQARADAGGAAAAEIAAWLDGHR